MCISSFNSTGFGIAVQAYIETILLFSNIVCLQEHFLLDAKDKKFSNTNKLRRKFSNHDMFIVPAHKPTTQVSKGRGKGGLATIWEKNLTKYVSKIQCDNFRIQATKFEFPSGPLLVINSYFPCDPRTINFDDTELLTLLSSIHNVIVGSGCRNIWLAGDLNAHFQRSTRFTNMVRDFLSDIGLYLLWENEEGLENIKNIDYTFMSTANGATAYSSIDHFACSRGVMAIIQEAGVIHHGDNPSNHSVIYAKLNVGELNLDLESIKAPRRICWSKSSEQARVKFQSTLKEKLSSLPGPMFTECSDIHCTNHLADIEEYTINILEAIEESAKGELASKGGGAKNKKGSKISIAGWTEFIKPYADESKFWHNIWISAGKPSEGALMDAMKQSKHQYKYAIRRLKKAGDSIQNDKFVSSILRGGVNIFSEIKKFRGKGSSCSSRIDDEVGSKNISDHFARIYSNLFNKVELGEDFNKLCRQINSEVGQHSMKQVDRVDEMLIKKALRMMKGNKADAFFDIQSDCLTNGPEELVSHLTLLFKSFISHGFVPYFILLCTLLPLVKDNLGDITSSENYRAIASGSLLLKLLDIVILLLEGDKLACDQLQFGFQQDSGTVMCSWTATSVINYFNRQGKPVYGCAMDLSKAFDMVDWEELFHTLKRRKVDPIFIRILIFMYRGQQCNVKWGQSFSFSFSVCNGVRQGTVSSPLFFSVYINDLIAQLRISGWGCYVGPHFYGCLGYADDLLLLSGSRTGLQAMVDIAEKFASSKNLKFSTNPDPIKSKTKCIVFARKASDRQAVLPIQLGGVPLPWVGQVKHLGNTLQSDNSMKVDMAIKRGKFIGKVNSLLQEFHFADPAVLVRILNIFTTSFYGSGLWDLQSPECDRLFKAWNVAIRHALGLPVRAHRYLIESLSGCLHPKTMLSSRLVKFGASLSKSRKVSVKFLSNLSQEDNRTVIGKNLKNIISSIPSEGLSTSNVKKYIKYFPVPDNESWRIAFIEELIEVRSGLTTIVNFDDLEIQRMIDILSTT